MKGFDDDTICLDCPAPGICCSFEVWVHGVRLIDDVPCEYQDPVTKLCTIYEKRHQVTIATGSTCTPVEEMYERGLLPRFCKYVENDEEYQNRDDLTIHLFNITVEPIGIERELMEKHGKLKPGKISTNDDGRHGDLTGLSKDEILHAYIEDFMHELMDDGFINVSNETDGEIIIDSIRHVLDNNKKEKKGKQQKGKKCN